MATTEKAPATKDKNEDRTKAVRAAFNVPESVPVYTTQAATWISMTEDAKLPQPATFSQKRNEGKGEWWVGINAELPKKGK